MISIDVKKMLHGPAGHLRLDIQAGIASGSFVTLFGASGAGKTTILRMLAGLVEPDSGSIVVDGKIWFDSAKRVHLPPQQRAIGFVFQDYALFPNLTVRENVAYAVSRDESAWIDELLALADLRQLQDRLPVTLSGGQKQRVALVRALARKPALLLLDEPLAAIDTGMRAQLQDELERLHQRFGLTTLLVSHDIGEVFRLSQRVLHLADGRIAQEGAPSELFLQTRMAGKFNIRAQVLALRREEVVYIVSLLIGQEIVDVIASEDEAAQLKPGDAVSVSSKAFNPILSRVERRE